MRGAALKEWARFLAAAYLCRQSAGTTTMNKN